MKITSAGASNIGRKRKGNQDAFLMEPSSQLFVVADGMGGHAGGEFASKITVETVIQSILNDKKSGPGLEPQDLIIGAIHRANAAVFSRAEQDKTLSGMGTTVLAMLFDKGKIFVGHVGDSRIYVARKGQLWQVTKDHSLVNEKLRAGLITRDQMRNDKARNVITRSVGFESSVIVDTYQKEVSPGEVYLACSDGLSGMVEDPEILKTLDEYAFGTGPLEEAVNKLIEKANNNGGEDNVTVVLVRIDKG